MTWPVLIVNGSVRIHTHWMTLAQDRGSWRTMIRGPEPEATQGGPAVRRARAQRSNHRHQHQHQPVHFQPAVAPHNYQQHAGNFNDMEGYVVHKISTINSWCEPNFQTGRPPLHRHDGQRRLSHLRMIAGQQRKTRRVRYM